MRRARNNALRWMGWLTGLAAILTAAVAIFVYSGPEHRDAATSIAREFFVRMEKASRAKSAPVSAPANPVPKGGVIQ